MDTVHPIEEVLRTKGLLSMRSNYEVKDKIGLSMVYTPGVGECCMQIKSDPARLYALTSAESMMYVLSNGSTFHPEFLQHPPSFMLPALELQSYVYKALSNINAIPLVFDSNVIKTPEDLSWLLTHISPCVSVLELFAVSEAYWQGAETELDKLEAVVLLPSSRASLLDKLSSSADNNYLVSLILGLTVKVFVRLRRFGVVKLDFLDNLIQRASEDLHDYTLDELSLKRRIIGHIFAVLNINKPESQTALFCDTNVDYISHETERDLFYRNYKEGSAKDNAVFLHERLRGMIRTGLSVHLGDLKGFLSKKAMNAIGEVCRKIFDKPELALSLSVKKNYCAIVTDGTAILGFGNIGPRAGLPVMEGKICLFQQLGHTNVVPLCLKSQGPNETIRLVKSLGDSFNAINLEDISAPNCFTIEAQLNKELPIPIFHDDQHGTAIVVLAALINSLKVIGRKKETMSVVVNGAGAAGKAIVDLLLHYGFGHIIVVDTKGAIVEGRSDLKDNPFKADLASRTNSPKEHGTLAEILKGKDVFIGVSIGKVLNSAMVASMNKDPIIFALANPEPEIYPDEAKNSGARIVATGRSDFPNQINNSLVFPGIFKGLIDTKVKEVTLELKVTAAIALAHTVHDDQLSETNILPYTLDLDVAHIIAESLLKKVKEN